MICPEAELTSAHLDGELSAEDHRAIERHIATCRDCQELVEAAADISERLHSPSAHFTAPARLRWRIDQDLQAEARALNNSRLSRRGRTRFWQGAFSGVGVSALAAAVMLAVMRPPAPQTVVEKLTDAHVRALMGGKVIEVVSSNHHTVKPWFAGRAPLSPPVADLAYQGFALEGGRVESVFGQRAAVLVYRHGAHEIDLFVWNAQGAPPASQAERRGYHLLLWTKGDLAFAAISDVQNDELMRFTDLIRAEPE